MRKKQFLHNDREATKILDYIKADSNVLKMKRFIQHGKVSTYDHCERVARASYRIDRFLSLNSDLKVLITAAMLHDFYLYDWHKADNGEHRFHGFIHARRAGQNATKYLNVDEKTSDAICSHMWPINPKRVPSSKEAWVIWFADKVVALHETVHKRK